MTTAETTLDVEPGTHWNGYFIGGHRYIRPATADELASGYHKFRVHVFPSGEAAEAWLEESGHAGPAVAHS